jgi:alcohol dehydrogenase class IV
MQVEIVDPLCRCIDSLFNATTTPKTTEAALEAISIMARPTPNDGGKAVSLADAAGDGGNLGLAHCLARALEVELGIGHDLAVGVITPRVIRFNAPVAGDMMPRLALALGLETEDEDPERVAIGIVATIFSMYEVIGFPRFFDPHDFDPDLIPDMAMAAGRGLHGEGYLETPPTLQTLIPSRNKRRATIREAGELFEQCFA